MQSVAAAPLVVLRYEPAAHSVAADAPATQYDPAGQSTHSDWPLLDWYCPAAHEAQLAAPVLLLWGSLSACGGIRWIFLLFCSLSPQPML